MLWGDFMITGMDAASTVKFFDMISQALTNFGVVATEFISDFWSCLPVGLQTIFVSSFVILAGGALFLRLITLIK